MYGSLACCVTSCRPRHLSGTVKGMKKTTSGFTIVELLIVIVVIAILATISIVAYQGIQQRAKTAAYTSAVDYWDRFLQAEIAIAGSLPASGGWMCLGRSSADFPEGGGFDEGECFKSEATAGTGVYAYNDSFFSMLQGDSSRTEGLLPSAKYAWTVAHGAPVDITYTSRGVSFSVNTTAKYYTLQWISQVGGQCGRGYSAVGAEEGSLNGGVCALTRYY